MLWPDNDRGGSLAPSVTLVGPPPAGGEAILSADALSFLTALVRSFRTPLAELLDARRERQQRLDDGDPLDFLAGTRDIRASDWRVAELPRELLDRRVEITGPVDRKMIINGLNSGANVFMADFEDSTSPTWDNLILGQRNVRDAVERTISYTAPDTGKVYRLNERPAILMTRPRGLHLHERHILVDGDVAPASLVDFGLFFFHNARTLLSRGTAPYVYLPKLESHREARWWSDVLSAAETALNIPHGSVRATVLIETLPAVFEMDEILYELRDYITGLNCGRWDYIFSYIKTFRTDPTRLVPDRAELAMTQPFLRAYTQFLVKTCHRRGAFAIGGMAAQIPIRDDARANDAAIAKVRADKLREVQDGHDGTWVAHPGLVPLAREVFDAHMSGMNNLENARNDVKVTAQALCETPEGQRTEGGLRHNIRVGIQYLEAWLRGQGCVPLNHLMEDAATAEISRSQVWQWAHHNASLSDGTRVTHERVARVIDEEVRALAKNVQNNLTGRRLEEARQLFVGLSTAHELADFLTVPAYDLLTEGH